VQVEEGQRNDVDVVRAFNRAVTNRVGALSDRYLSRDRPLPAARLLWEIGDGPGTEVRALRARLGLDSGYTSRLLRTLEAGGLVTVAPDATDRRIRKVTLTKKGRVERALLDRRSDHLATSMLEPLDEGQRLRLVAAMAEVERLLRAAMVRIDVVDPDGLQARYCLEQYVAELDRRFEAGFDLGSSRRAGPEEMRFPNGVFLLATLRGEAVGCGGLKFHDGGPSEVKRMWISPVVRGLGVGRRLLQALEAHAAERPVRRVRLDTNRTLVEAIALYRAMGYCEIPAYNDEPYAGLWFEKELAEPDDDVS
jgi:DNA-binding MarR family transcriptional regulator